MADEPRTVDEFLRSHKDGLIGVSVADATYASEEADEDEKSDEKETEQTDEKSDEKSESSQSVGYTTVTSGKSPKRG